MGCILFLLYTPSLMAGGHLAVASVLFVNATLTCGFEILAKVF
jgi:hypothetical protein